MAKSRAAVTFGFGLRDRVEPRLAPFGVLKVGQNLRLRKDGRLGTRHGYQPLSMTTAGGTLVAHDVHEYRGRLVALGSDNDDGFPADIYEYLGLANQGWRGTDAIDQRITLCPFTNQREVAGILQIEDGVGLFDAVASGGYVCMVYRRTGSTVPLYALIVGAETDQTILSERLQETGGAFGGHNNGSLSLAICAIGTTFYVAARQIDNIILIGRYRVGTDARFTLFATPKGTTTAAGLLDLVAVSHPTTAAIAIAYTATSTTLEIKVYTAAGAQLGSTITVTISNVLRVVLEADQADNTINLYTIEGTDTGLLRTYNFAGTLLDGPTATTVGASGSMTRLPAQTGFAEHVAVAVNKSDNSVEIKVFDQDAHTVTSTLTVEQAHLRSRPLAVQSPGQSTAVAFAGVVGPQLPTDHDQATNALFYVTPTVQHMATRDFVRGKDVNIGRANYPSLSRDATTAAICWAASRDPGVESDGMPVVTLVDFRSTARRHAVEYGGLLYIAGATPTVYDGRMGGELGFSEAPGIHSFTKGNTASGELEPGATYYYAVHWEIVLADGSLMVSPVSVGGNAGESVSSAAVVTLGATDNFVLATVTTPHSVRIAAGDALAGATVVAVLSRTEWIVTRTAAALLGTRDFTTTPAVAGDLTSKTLQIQVDGGGTQTVTFSATDDSVTEVVAAINAQTTGLTASVVGGSVYLESDTEGTSSTLVIIGGTATAAGAAFVGFLTGATSTGTAEGEPGSVLRRCQTKAITSGVAFSGKTTTITDLLSDDDLGSQEPIYTQGDRGALSGPLEQNSPRAFNYLTATESRLLTGGLSRPFDVQISRSAFLGEVFSFSEFSPFFAKAPSPVVGVQSLDGAKLIFTNDRILSLTGDGPDDVGGGALDPPIEIPTSAGLSNSWALFKAPDGLWFQLDDTKLFRIPRGGGSPSWEGVDVQDVLRDYPTIVGACRHKGDNVAVFACQGSGDPDSVFVVRDFRTENWFVDVPPVEDVSALTSYGASLAFVADGDVWFQVNGSFVDNVNTFIVTTLRTHPLYPFGVNGYGNIYELLLTGEYRDDCVLGLRVSYDDGITFTTLESFDLVGLTAGQTIQRKWTLPQDVTSSVVLEFTCGPSDLPGARSATEGFAFTQVDLLVEPESGLRELPAAEMA